MNVGPRCILYLDKGSIVTSTELLYSSEKLNGDAAENVEGRVAQIFPSEI